MTYLNPIQTTGREGGLNVAATFLNISTERTVKGRTHRVKLCIFFKYITGILRKNFVLKLCFFLLCCSN